jgi:hypothetical protein
LAMAGHSPAAPGPAMAGHSPATPRPSLVALGLQLGAQKRGCRGRGGLEPTTSLFGGDWATFCFVIYGCDICYLYYLSCHVKITKNDVATRFRTLAAGDVKHCLTIVLWYHWCLALAFFHTWIRSERLDQSCCATSLI